MTNYNILTFLLLLTRSSFGQYLLAEYAPNHDNYAPAHYHFSYGVSDPSTGDHKHHWEKRQGDHVVGEYGLLEPDGATRIVQYTADPHQGFKAVVTRIENNHLQPQYTTGQSLYGGYRQGLFNEANVVQFGQHQVAVTPLPYTTISDYGERLPQVPHANQYYLNQYAGHYQANLAPQSVEINNNGHELQGHYDGHVSTTVQPYQYEGHGPSTPQPYNQYQIVSSTPQPYLEQQRPVVVKNTYSTLQHQPNFEDIKVEHRINSLPQHVIDNINNQYGRIGDDNVEPRGFSHHLENGGQGIAQNVNALQENIDHNQNVQHYVSSTPAYVSSTQPRIGQNGYESNANIQHGGYVSSTVPSVQQNYVSSTESPIQHNYVSSTQAPIQQNYVPSTTQSPLEQNYVTPIAQHNEQIAQQHYVSSTQNSNPYNYVTSTESPLLRPVFL